MKKISTIVVCFALLLSLIGCKSTDYKNAIAFQDAGDYESAVAIYEELGEYEDAAIRLEECNNMISYNEAISLLEDKDYSSALVRLEELGSFKDATEKKTYCEEILKAIEDFEAANDELLIKNNALDLAISEANEIIQSGEKALDETIRPTVETAISEAKAKKVELPETPEILTDIIAKTDEVSSVDYTDVLRNLKEHKDNLERSIKQYALVNNPTEKYVINCLTVVPGVIDISAVTEDNDPNGNLGKAGGYTAAVYFSHENVNQSEVVGDTIIEKGTACGGQIEVYESESDANKRNEYLASFDGTILSSGSHTVVGTCVVRTSDELKASQQKELEANIIAALTNIN